MARVFPISLRLALETHPIRNDRTRLFSFSSRQYEWQYESSLKLKDSTQRSGLAKVDTEEDVAVLRGHREGADKAKTEDEG